MAKFNEYIINPKFSDFFIIKKYQRGQVLFNEEENCKYAGYILNGQIKIVTSTYYEKEEIISVINQDEWFGNILIFTSKPYFLGTGIALTNVKVAYIDKPNLLTLCTQDQSFMNLFFEYNSEIAIATKNQAKLFCHKNIRDRIIYHLNTISKKTKSKIIIFESVQKLANELSIPRPSVSRELIKMENDNLIKKNHNIITILY